MTQTHIHSFTDFFLMKTQEWKDCYAYRNIRIRGSKAKYETGMKELMRSDTEQIWTLFWWKRQRRRSFLQWSQAASWLQPSGFWKGYAFLNTDTLNLLLLLPEQAIFSWWSMGTIAIRAQLGSLTLTFMLIFFTTCTLCSNLAMLACVSKLVAVEATHRVGNKQGHLHLYIAMQPWSLPGVPGNRTSRKECWWGSPSPLSSVSLGSPQPHPDPLVHPGSQPLTCQRGPEIWLLPERSSGSCDCLSINLFVWSRFWPFCHTQPGKIHPSTF